MNRSTIVCVLGVLAIGAFSATAGASLLTNGGFEQDTHPTMSFPGWVNVPGQGGNKGESFVGGEHGLGIYPYEGNQDIGWISGWDTSRHQAFVYQQFAQPLNTDLTISGVLASYAGWGGWPQIAVGRYDSQVGLYYDRLGRTNIIPLLSWAGDHTYATPIDPDVTMIGLVSNGDTYDDVTAPGGDGWIEVSGTANSGSSAVGTVFVLNIHKWGFFNGGWADAISVVPEPASALLLLVGALGLRRRV